MPEYKADSELSSHNVASWNGKNIYQINRYPNMQMVLGVGNTSGVTVNQGTQTSSTGTGENGQYDGE